MIHGSIPNREHFVSVVVLSCESTNQRFYYKDHFREVYYYYDSSDDNWIMLQHSNTVPHAIHL